MLEPFDEIQFIQQLSLKHLTQKSAGYNFSCPLCNEGKSPHKRRGWILLAGAKHDHNTFMCHNCLPQGTSVRRFIEAVDPVVHEKYRAFEKVKYIEDIKSGKIIGQKKKSNINNFKEQLTERPKYIFELSKKTFIPCSIVPAALAYARSRKIPEEIIKTLYYCPRRDVKWSGMLIFPFWFDQKHVYGFQGRSIKGKRFSTFMTNDAYKVYNLYGVDKTSNAYIFESIIDSYVIPNSIAMVGADLSKPVRESLDRPIFVFDNDRTGEEKTLKYIKQGEQCFIWPDAIQAKDFGQLVEKGIEKSQLRKLIKSRIFSDFQGEVEIKLKLSKSKKTFRRIEDA